MSGQLILALDIGTSGIRGALSDSKGRIIPASLVRVDQRPLTTRDGGSVIDPGQTFKNVLGVIDGVLQYGKGDIGVIAVSSLWHSLAGIDENQRPTTPAFTLADNRSRDFVRHLRNDLDETETHNRVGARFHSSYWPAKLLRLRKTDPKVFRSTVKWLSLPDYLTLKFCGQAATSISMASGTGIFDIGSLCWDPGLCRYLRITDKKLPSIAQDNEGFPLLKKFIKRWPRLKNAKWLPAIGDGAAANLGSGCIGHQRAALTIGTTAAIRLLYRGKPPLTIPSGLFCYRYDSRFSLLGGALSDGGGIYGQIKKLCGISKDEKSLAREIMRRAAGRSGLIFLPFINGERSTGYNEFARGGVFGLTSATDAVDILTAAIEGIGFRLAAIADQIEEVFPLGQITGSGGAFCGSPAIRQVVADILGRDIRIAEDCDASLRGAALHAALTAGKIENIESVVKSPRSKVKSDARRHNGYKAARARHDRIYKIYSSNETNENLEKHIAENRY